MRPVIFRYLCIKICALPANTVYNFFVLKGTYQRNRCTFQNSIKSNIFIFDSAPCQISLYLHHIFFLHNHKVNNFFFFFQRYLPKKKVHFQKLYKITNLHFLQCALSDFFIFASKLVLYLRTQFSIFSSFKGTYERNR